MKIKGVEYKDVGAGVLVPVMLLRESHPVIRSAKDSLPWLSAERSAEQERVVVLTLDGQHKIIRKHIATIGLVNQCQIHPREIFRPAIHDNAVSIIVVHNHPSGNSEPSDADITATKRLMEASKIIGITFLDHLVITTTSCTSIREQWSRIWN